MTSNTQHFSTEGAGTPTAKGRFVDVSAIEAREMVAGLNFRPVLGEGMIINVVTYEPNTVVPMHSHVEEQITMVLEGEFEFTLDGTTRTMRKGDIAMIPSWVPHGARTLNTTCKQIDVFNPPRATLIDHATGQVERSSTR